ncbi:MAG TPA: hypothetical protein VM533_05240 [Fimbriiglobus sp.]|nr:hypothetical protein [Fimbriiglobus sp.]
MSKTTFSLHSHDGPAQINGVDFTAVHISEHADSEGIVILKGWEGTATVLVKDAPAITPEWSEDAVRKPVEVRLPEGGTGQALLTDVFYIDDGLEYWRISFTGVGPSPWAEASS